MTSGRLGCEASGQSGLVTAITVLRVPSSLGGTARRYKIFIDGVERGRLAGGEEVEVDVEPGDHEIQGRVDWSGSEIVKVTVRDGETASFAVAPAAQTHVGQFKTMFGRRSFLTVTPV
jgi:hypothetical protein